MPAKRRRSTSSHASNSAPAPGSTPSSNSPRTSAGIRLTGSQRQHVHRSPRRQPQLQRIPAQRAGDPKSATQLRQRPAQRPTRIIGIAEDQPGQPRARHRPLRQNHVRQHGPRLMTTRRNDNHAVALDLRRPQQADHERRHDITIVNPVPYAAPRQRSMRTAAPRECPPSLLPSIPPDRRRSLPPGPNRGFRSMRRAGVSDDLRKTPARDHRRGWPQRRRRTCRWDETPVSVCAPRATMTKSERRGMTLE